MSDEPREDAPRRRRGERPGPGDDPRARPLRAPRPGQGARRARRGPAGQAPLAQAHRAARWADWTSRPRILVTNDDGIESRGLLALKLALDPIGDVTVVAPDLNQSAVGHTEDADAAAARAGADPRGRLHRLLGRRLPHRLRLALVPGLLRGALRPRRVRHQLRRQPGRRHHLLRDGVGGDGGGHQQLPGVRDQPGVRGAHRLRARGEGGGGRRAQHPGARPAARRAAVRQRAGRAHRGVRRVRDDARRPADLLGRADLRGSTRAGSPTTGSAGRRRPGSGCPARTSTRW